MSKNKINLVLDLDQTLISAEDLKTFDGSKYEEKIAENSPEVMDDLYIIFSRPHLQEFLDFAFKNFNVSVWTAASKSYALFIIEKFIVIKPNRKLDFIFFSYHCDYSQKCDKGLKGLRMLWEDFNLTNYNLSNTIIIDDNPDVKSIQHCNCYDIKPYFFRKKGSENDTELLKLIEKLANYKHNLSSSPSMCMINNLH